MATSSAPPAKPSAPPAKPSALLFVCLGNICRSPAAEAVFRHLVTKRGLDSQFLIDSAGTIGYHEEYISSHSLFLRLPLNRVDQVIDTPFRLRHFVKTKGNPSDSRMRAAAKKRGIEVTSISRPIRPSDFRDFDLILPMDFKNKEDILSAYKRWGSKESFPEGADNKVRLMCSYCQKHSEKEVPDPYYGGAAGFEKVLDLLEDACESLLDTILAEKNGSVQL